MRWIDGTLYPDGNVPSRLSTVGEQIDFIARLCSAWDFGLLPRSETIAELRRENWRDAVDRCGLSTSPSYHLLREWHGLPPEPFLGSLPAYVLEDPNLFFI